MYTDRNDRDGILAVLSEVAVSDNPELVSAMEKLELLRSLLREESPTTMRRFEEYEARVAALREVAPVDTGPEDYSHCYSGTDAAVAYLLRHGPSKRIPMARAIAATGWKGKGGNAKSDPVRLILDGIDNQAKVAKSPRLKVNESDIVSLL